MVRMTARRIAPDIFMPIEDLYFEQDGIQRFRGVSKQERRTPRIRSVVP
jgi:hypothetical protein